MKLEITDVMICEWDADTKCIIVSPADGWKVNVNHPISEAHASLVTMEKMEGDGYEFICKWLRCANSEQVLNFTTDRWYKCMGNFHRTGAFMGDFCRGGFAPNNHKHFDLTDARDYNPDELIGKWIKRTDASTLKESWGKLKDITGNSLHNLNPIFTFEDGEMWGKIACDVDDPRDYNPDERTPGEEARDIALRNIDESKKIKVEPNPHQLKEYDAVECNAEERAQIIRIADECGVPVYNETRTPKDSYPNLAWYNGEVAGLLNIIELTMEFRQHTVPDFIAKIRGTYVENEVNVSEHKHPEIV